MRPAASRNAKWLVDVTAAMPVTRAARVALKARLAMVDHYLRRAVRGRGRDTEDVHQLRVFTRRALAAQHAFAPLLPMRRGKWMANRLRLLRRAAGDPRDWDVFLERLPVMAGDDEPELARALCRLGRKRRRQARRPLEAAARKWRRPASRRRIRRALKQLGPVSADSPLADCQGAPVSYAAASLVGVGQALDQFLAAAVDQRSSIAELHQFRIRAKELRYGMELFAAGLDGSFREELYPLVEQLQERLGQINDHAAAVELLENGRADLKPRELQPALDRLIERQRREMIAARAAFHAWWTPDEQAAFRAAFDRHLGRPAIAGRLPAV